jgi:transposase
VDGLMENGYEVKLVNTMAVKTYEGLKYTGDEHDARHLAHLLRLGILPTGHIYPKEERGVRDLLRKRGQLVQQRTANLLSVQSHISRHRGRGMSVAEIRKLNAAAIVNLCEGDQMRMLAIASHMKIIRCLDQEIEELERVVLARAKIKPAFQNLLTVVGVGPILGMTILYEMGSPDRFAEVGHFASYARCVSSSRWSNGKKKGSGNRKNGNKYLAWAFVEAAHYATRFNERIRRFYQRKQAKANGAVAVKAVAHKLARACYYVIRDRVPFDVERAFA